MSEELLSNNDLDFSAEDGSRPLLNQITLRCITGEVRFEDDKRNKVTDLAQAVKLVIPVTLDEPARAANGKDVHPGFMHTDSIWLVPTGKLTKEMVRDKVAAFQRAALGLKRGEKGRPFSPEECSGKPVNVHFEIEVGGDGVERQRARRFGAVVS